MMIRILLGAVIAAVVIGIAIAFLWVQVGLPAGITSAPWDSPIRLFPSLFAFWIPLIYLFFTSLWFTLALPSLSDQERLFFRLDQCWSFHLFSAPGSLERFRFARIMAAGICSDLADS
jgi:hypothetical protein